MGADIGGNIESYANVCETAREHAFPGVDKGVKILASKLGDDAGITGGAVLARRETK